MDFNLLEGQLIFYMYTYAFTHVLMHIVYSPLLSGQICGTQIFAWHVVGVNKYAINRLNSLVSFFNPQVY